MGLETTLRGLLAQQSALDVTGHNITNTNTDGYTRQTAELTAAPAYDTNLGGTTVAGQIGTGVTVSDYQRVRDSFIDVQLRAQTMRQGYSQATQDGLQQVELSLNEPSDNGLNSLLQNYWNAWQDVSNAPENVANRQALLQNASSLAEGFRTVSSQLDTIASQTAQNVTDTMGDVNSMGRQIAQLNSAISSAESTGQTPNDLLDQRDLLIDKLSSLGNVGISNGQAGSVDVTIGGVSLVSGTSATTLGELDMPSLTSGSLAGMVQLRDVTVPSYKSQLDAVALALKNATNAQQAAGFDLNGNAGGAFFTGTGASDIDVDPTLMANPALVAASGSGQPGDASNAIAIADLRNQPLIGSATIDSAYAQLVSRVGSDSQESQRMLANAQLLVGSLQDRRESVSGVSLDEEMTNLTKFQRGYQASARAMTAIDQMLQTLITQTGKAGL
jgi:flagellar hook-associated protein 1